MNQTFRDRVVLVTGASSGIGAALARRFAADGARLILVARRRDRLEALAAELRAGRPADAVHLLVADLSADRAADAVARDALAVFGRIDVLVNNAGVGEYGPFAAQNIDTIDCMMHLNVNALVRLTHAILADMTARREGWILNVASMAAFQPTPYMGVYGATKSFVLDFSLALRYEVRKKGVIVSCVCPAGVKTEFFDRGGFDDRRDEFLKISVEPAFVAESAYRALVRNKAFVIPGRMNQFGVFIQRFVPITLITRVSARLLGPRK
jgi:short-subunit dehydrogenase